MCTIHHRFAKITEEWNRNLRLKFLYTRRWNLSDNIPQIFVFLGVRLFIHHTKSLSSSTEEDYTAWSVEWCVQQTDKYVKMLWLCVQRCLRRQPYFEIPGNPALLFCMCYVKIDCSLMFCRLWPCLNILQHEARTNFLPGSHLEVGRRWCFS